jgi:hypothetical protein
MMDIIIALITLMVSCCIHMYKLIKLHTLNMFWMGIWIIPQQSYWNKKNKRTIIKTTFCKWNVTRDLEFSRVKSRSFQWAELILWGMAQRKRNLEETGKGGWWWISVMTSGTAAVWGTVAPSTRPWLLSFSYSLWPTNIWKHKHRIESIWCTNKSGLL